MGLREEGSAMSLANPAVPMTTEALLARANDGTDRWLIRGELRERPMTVRNRLHSKVMASVTASLKLWRDSQPEPRADVLCGEAGVRLARDPDTTVGIDVVVVSAETLARQSDETALIDGVPLLAVEILSPSDTIVEVNEKIDVYLSTGVPLVWIIDPYRRTVTVYRPSEPPRIVAGSQELSGEPALPGFRVVLADLFR
jgi:Uma2 family endonuclease